MRLAEQLSRNIDKKVAKSLSSCAERCTALSTELLGNLPALQSQSETARDEALLTERSGTSICYRLISGEVSLRCSNRIVYIFEPGDIFGLTAFYTRKEVALFAETDCVLDIFRVSDVLDQLDRDASLRQVWAELSAHKTFILNSVIASNIVAERQRLLPRTVVFKPGKAILKENSRSSDVFVLLEGRAVATRGGVPVGTIREDEIFGAIAALTDSPRTATVTALNQCTCLVYSKKDFRQLIEDCPGIVSHMIDGMARAVASANQKLVR